MKESKVDPEKGMDEGHGVPKKMTRKRRKGIVKPRTGSIGAPIHRDGPHEPERT